mgnify:CR=1 FL=1
MVCGSTKQADSYTGIIGQQVNHRAEAERYARLKKAGFRDSGLERHRQDCIKQKKKLHHVEDPTKKQKQKIAAILKDIKKKPQSSVAFDRDRVTYAS